MCKKPRHRFHKKKRESRFASSEGGPKDVIPEMSPPLTEEDSQRKAFPKKKKRRTSIRARNLPEKGKRFYSSLRRRGGTSRNLAIWKKEKEPPQEDTEVKTNGVFFVKGPLRLRREE